jgi:hypothetical protein
MQSELCRAKRSAVSHRRFHFYVGDSKRRATLMAKNFRGKANAKNGVMWTHS